MFASKERNEDREINPVLLANNLNTQSPHTELTTHQRRGAHSQMWIPGTWVMQEKHTSLDSEAGHRVIQMVISKYQTCNLCLGSIKLTYHQSTHQVTHTLTLAFQLHSLREDKLRLNRVTATTSSLFMFSFFQKEQEMTVKAQRV